MVGSFILTTFAAFFTIFHINRQRAAKRLAKLNAAKERMESELSIARDIQMSMNAHAERFRDGAEPNDDLTMMCVFSPLQRHTLTFSYYVCSR